MAEHLRRTTAFETGQKRTGIVTIGQGQSADILLDFSHPGTCMKIPYVWRDNEAERVAGIYDRLRRAGFPVLPYFNVAWGGEFYEMTDLTDGLRNLVISQPDIYRVDDQQERRRWFEEWHSVTPVNLTEFGAELNGILHLAADTQTPINSVGLFLTATPKGVLHTYIADYEDGILHHEVGRTFDDRKYQEQIGRIQTYLQAVQNFFPAVSRIKLK